jgi:hypothetical protein
MKAAGITVETGSDKWIWNLDNYRHQGTHGSFFRWCRYPYVLTLPRKSSSSDLAIPLCQRTDLERDMGQQAAQEQDFCCLAQR